MLSLRYHKILSTAVPSILPPLYLGLVAYACRQAPWPRDIAVAASASLVVLSLAWLSANLSVWFFKDGGPAQSEFQLPANVSRQCEFALLGVTASSVVFLLPSFLLMKGLFAANGRPVIAPMAVRVLNLAFELSLFVFTTWVLRKRSAFILWMTDSQEKFGGLMRRRRFLSALILASVGGVLALDLLGYSYSAKRLASGGVQSLGVLLICGIFYRFVLRFIDHHAWRWVKMGNALARHQTHDDNSNAPEDLALKLRRLAVYLVPMFGLFLLTYVWDVDMALFRFLGSQELWSIDKTAEVPIYVTVEDLTKAVVVFILSAAAWRHMSTFFVLAVFPRMPDDPGIRFAVVTLCRYIVLGAGLLTGLSAIHLGLEKIGVVLAALGVGLGFGLQEIVSNFICGIILLLERPIRVGDIVTVSGTTGKVDRINIRATSIINGDNQSMIVPNRAFITGDLVNWTLKDKIIRVSVRVRTRLGTDPDKVADLLLSIAREDADILCNPVPVALLEDFGESALVFVLFAYVPDPGLGGRVKHGLYSRIQKRFAEAGIEIPLPSRELSVKGMQELAETFKVSPKGGRVDPPSPIPAPHLNQPVVNPVPIPVPSPLETCNRGVDE